MGHLAQGEYRHYARKGELMGAERLGHQWVIPINAEKPKDARIKSGKYIKTKSGNGENEDGKKTV